METHCKMIMSEFKKLGRTSQLEGQITAYEEKLADDTSNKLQLLDNYMNQRTETENVRKSLTEQN